jgi:glycosyltransferase involved in cell wall biosynthesis
VDPADTDYFDREVRPLLDHPLVDFIGEIGEQQKGEFLGGADALLFPIDWPEPFGLVMIEALACGTPVVAFRAGSVPEVIDEGVTGFVVDNLDDAILAASRVGEIDRRDCRRVFDTRYTTERMTQRYVEVYERLLRSSVPEIPISRGDGLLSESKGVAL